MGFLGLIPADDLAASYSSADHILTLYARGQVQDFTSGIDFERLPWMGGFKFQLQGWTGPLREPATYSPYTHEQGFKLQLPSQVAPSGSVIIATANHPQGVAVPVRFLGPLPPKDDQPLAAAAAPATDSAPTADEPQVLAGSHEQLNVLFKMPFTIKEAAQVPQQGSVQLTFDRNMLQLQQAGIDGGNIVWTMNSLQTGDTQVIVTMAGGIAPYIIRKVYDVRVFVLDQAPVSAPAPQAILSFLGRVNIAVRLVQEQYPDAELYEVEALPPVPQGVSNPNALSQLKVVFRAGKGTAIIQSTGWGTFGPVQYIDQPWLEDRIVPWPVRMEATEADALLKKAGYTGPYGAMTLRHPLQPGFTEPYYIFSMKDGQYVYVGANDKKVTTNPAAGVTADAQATSATA